MIPILWLCAVAASPDAVERFYNSAKTLETRFEQRYVSGGRQRVESGTLTLRKPGRMRWDYENGKQFVADGKSVWFFQPAANRAEFSDMKASEDLRAPLAFLLGKLDFKRLFSSVREEGNEIVAIPKSDKLPYREVRFVAGADGEISQVTVEGQDASKMEFRFSGQRRNLPVDDAAFRFVPPPGVEVIRTRDAP